jgi:hypothetical protein
MADNIIMQWIAAIGTKSNIFSIWPGRYPLRPRGCGIRGAYLTVRLISVFWAVRALRRGTLPMKTAHSDPEGSSIERERPHQS